MPTTFGLAFIFAESFALYSFLRYFDVQSTRKLAERLDIQKHEANSLLTLVARRWGLDTAFRVTWLLFAFGIAAADTFLGIAVNWGVPAVALLTGTAHLLASASNMELEYRTRNMRSEEIEAETYAFAKQLSELDWKGRWSLLAERYAFNFVVTVISTATLLLFTLSNTVATIASSNSGAAMANMAIVNMAALLLFFPAVFLGTVLWSRRLVRFYQSGRLDGPAPSSGRYIEIPLLVAEQAVSLAKLNQSTVIRLQLDQSVDS